MVFVVAVELHHKTFSRRCLTKVAYCPFYALHFSQNRSGPTASGGRPGVWRNVNKATAQLKA